MILFEDDVLLVLNKPAGLVCHPTRGDEDSSLIGRVRRHLGHAEGRLVNRLDRETSGVVLVAKGAGPAGELGRLFGTAAISKTYWAIVHGHVADAPFTIDAPIGKDVASPVAIKDCVRPDGAAARTTVRLLRTFDRLGAPFSGLDCSRRPAASTRSGSISRTSAIPSWVTRFMAATRCAICDSSAGP